MKINEKHLTLFANSNATIDKQGYLNKRGEVNKAFQKRWFILKGNLLFYYDKKGDSDPIGVIILEGCSVELTENSEKFAFELAFLGSGARTYVLAAESQDEMEDWMKALACSGYDYMKCAVDALQRQLDELKAAEQRTRLSQHMPRAERQSRNSKFGSSRLGRFNPFDEKEDEQLTKSAELSANRSTVMAEGGSGRSFQEMHAEFGSYIHSKVRQHSMLHDPMQDLSLSQK
jgi:hypothetical protein